MSKAQGKFDSSVHHPFKESGGDHPMLATCIQNAQRSNIYVKCCWRSFNLFFQVLI